MIRKTEGIVLKTLKFQESSLITTLFTREFGRQSFIVQGARSARGAKKHSYFQPMSVIDIVYYHRDTRDLQKITETRNAHLLREMQTRPVKIALGMALVEIFGSAVQEEEQNQPLYNFLRESIINLDQQPDKLIHHFLFFLVHLTAYLGFFPMDEVQRPDDPVVFDLFSGTLSNTSHPTRDDRLIRDLVYANETTCRDLQFSNDQKRDLIRSMLQYFQVHLEGFREPESIKVFEEVFS